MPAAVLISELGPRDGLQGGQATRPAARAVLQRELPPGLVDADRRIPRAEVRA